MSDQRDVSIIAIPIEIWENPDLTLFETCLLAEITSLDCGEGCWKSDANLAKRMRCCLGHLKNKLVSLKRRKYLFTLVKGKHRRALRSCFSRHLRSKREVTSKVSEKLLDTSSTMKSKITLRCGTSVPLPSMGFFLNGDLDDSPNSETAKRLTRLFYELLSQNRLDSARADLPSGNSQQSKDKRKSTFRRWCRVCDELIQSESPKKVKRVMRWYFDHCREEWVGTHIAMTTFCENFLKLEKMMRRDNAQNGNPDPQESTPKAPIVVSRRVHS